jgi:hypothetical protein
MNIMSLLQPAKPEAAFLKMGIYGDAKSGKTFTSASVLIGFHKFMKSDKPIAFMDTETGSDYVQHRFRESGIPLLVAKTRSFKDLLAITDEAEKSCFALLVDSITHPWDELMNAYQKQHNKTRLSLGDWIPIKAMWREFTTKYIGSRLHIIVCGRAGDKWEDVTDENGVKELRKTGTRMRTEKELGYEPSLLVEMESVQTEAKFGGSILHRAYVKGDRFDVINGRIFEDPTFETFLPHIQMLNLGGEHKALEPDRSSVGMFDDPNMGEKRALNKEILCEKIANEIKKLFPAQTEKDKADRVKLMEEVFGTNSWTEISTLFKNDRLAIGLEILQGKVAAAFAPSTDVPAASTMTVVPEAVKVGKKEKKS